NRVEQAAIQEQEIKVTSKRLHLRLIFTTWLICTPLSAALCASTCGKRATESLPREQREYVQRLLLYYTGPD
ncbi:hypothetical protein GN958_ATG17217, partial [Phytophthora infestans]